MWKWLVVKSRISSWVFFCFVNFFSVFWMYLFCCIFTPHVWVLFFASVIVGLSQKISFRFVLVVRSVAGWRWWRWWCSCSNGDVFVRDPIINAHCYFACSSLSFVIRYLTLSAFHASMVDAYKYSAILLHLVVLPLFYFVCSFFTSSTSYYWTIFLSRGSCWRYANAYRLRRQ